jgi:hypothetical protein
MKTLLPLTALATSLLLCAGCASTGYEKATQTSTSLQEAARDIDHALLPIDNAVAMLSDLVNNPQPDVTPQFKKYSAAVTKLESMADDVRSHASAMREQGTAYFKVWDQELAKIQNEDVHSRSLERKNAVAARFEKVRASYARTSTEFAPFMADLKDIRRALATDLTSGGIASVKDLASKANSKVPPLRESLIGLSTDFRSLGVSLSTTTPVQN